MKKQSFVCQYDGRCPIDKSIRCACRYCRFKKCLEVGMDRAAIQQNRDPIGYTKRTRRYSVLKPAATRDVVESSVGSVMEESTEQALEDQFLQALTDVEFRCKKLREAQIQLNTDRSLLDAVLSPSILEDQMLLQSIENNMHSSAVLQPAQRSDYQYWHEKDWSVMIEWAKSIPAYQKLPIGDKLALLRHSAITYPSLLQCFYSTDRGPDMIIFPNGAYFDRTPEYDKPLGYQKRKYQMLDQLLNPMRKMKIDMSEFAAFKAIFFLNPDADDVSNASKESISEGRSSVTNALYRYMLKKTDVKDAADRFGKLLLLGTVLATMAVEMKEAVVVADFFNQIQFSPFAKQLLFGIKHEVD